MLSRTLDGHLVIVDGVRPTGLCGLIEDEWVTKVFHHAMFDLRFMAHAWWVAPTSIQCTKVAAKLADPDGEHSLQALVRRHLGIELDKSQRMSDWMTASLSAEQQAYAVADVLHLPHLVELQQKDLRALGMWSLASRCFAHLPTRVELEVRGISDPYTY